jgi:hypothetical protein
LRSGLSEVDVRAIFFATWLTLVPTIAAAQPLEAGGSIARGCLGSDGSICGSGSRPMVAGHVTWWLTDRTDLGLRVAHVGPPDYRFETVFPVVIRGAVTDRSRRFVSVLLVHHFTRATTVRPVLGLGSGWIVRSEQVACEPPGCGQAAGLPREGRHHDRMVDVIAVAGLSGTVKDRWVWRGGWLSHRFGNDENSTSEFFVALGYRLGRR